MMIVSGDRELISLALTAAYLKAPASAGATLADVVNEIAAGNDAEVGVAGDSLVEVVAGARTLRRRLEVIELEAARLARARGATVRQLAAATRMSERNAADRYRRDGGAGAGEGAAAGR
ncbi:MAG TPA: hypothetical protein VGL39_18310 [Jatrophihabitantaceae bacterium]